MRQTGVMHPAFFYLPGERLTGPELAAARLDGHVVDLGEGYIPADLVESAGTRARTIASLVPPHTAASGPTAAWVHGAGDRPPSRHHVRRAVSRRIRPALSPRVTFHDTALRPDDVESLGGVLVMTRTCTMVDLALSLHRDESVLRWMVLLGEVDPELWARAIAVVDAFSRVPGTRAGRAALERLSVRRR